MPYDDAVVVTAKRTETLLQSGNNDLNLNVPETLDAWTGNAGSVAVGLLCKVAAVRSAAVSLMSPRMSAVDRVMAAWVQSLLTPNKLQHSLCGWMENEQETLQFSLTNNIYN